MKTAIFTLPFALVVAACSSESTSAASPDAAVEASGSTTFDCYGRKCDVATQYCILSKQGSIVLASMCAPLPSACTTCSCAQSGAAKAWAAQNPNTNNCSATILCSSSDGEISVTCQR